MLSLLPHFSEEFGFRRPRQLFDQHFSVILPSADGTFTVVATPATSSEFYQPWRHQAPAAWNTASIKVDKEKFQINLDVQHFAPNEISVKVADGYIVVEGKHEEKKDHHGYISREFTRRYALPEDTLPENVESRISSDGVLIITAPLKVSESVKGERIVPITLTGPAWKEIKDQTTETDKKEEKQ